MNRCVQFKITRVIKPIISEELAIDYNNRIDTAAVVASINSIQLKSTNKYLIYVSIPYFLTEEEHGNFNKETGLRYQSLRRQILYIINTHFNSPKIVEESLLLGPKSQVTIKIYHLD